MPRDHRRAEPSSPTLVIDPAPDGSAADSKVPIGVGWTRIGRSPSADIRLDDASVSRRHALLIRAPDGALQVLDDRSLSGVHVNGRPVGWATLSDGDELRIGRFRLRIAAALTAASAEAA